MSDAHDPTPWFRTKDTGLGWTPATWQGWAITVAFCLLTTATVQLILPQTPSEATALPWLAAIRRDLGVPAAGLGLAPSVLAVGLEIGAFLVLCWWTSRPVRPLD